jgi:hypothetical protein
MLMLNHQHEYGLINDTMDFIKPAQKGICMNSLENFYISLYQHHNILLNEQNTCEQNHLCELLYDPSM